MKKRLHPYQPIVRLSQNGIKSEGIVNVPKHLKPMQFNRYPSDNAVTFERWLLESWMPKDACDRVYLPIQWTALYCNNGYGNAPIINTIQQFIDRLDASKKYYTVVQYDDGILNDISRLDIKVMAMSQQSNFNLPLLCTPHKFNFEVPAKKDIYANFIGSLTHSIRSIMIDQIDRQDCYVSTKQHSLRDYCQIIARSKYTLCPRGYGANSFRIQEAINFGSIPVIISDEFVFPYGMPTFPFGLVIQMGAHDDVDIIAMLKQADEAGYDKVTKAIIEQNEKLFTYAGCKNEILTYLKNESNDTPE